MSDADRKANIKLWEENTGQDFKKARKNMTDNKASKIERGVTTGVKSRGDVLSKPLYQTNLTNALDEIYLMKDKGYGNVREVIKKIQQLNNEPSLLQLLLRLKI